MSAFPFLHEVNRDRDKLSENRLAGAESQTDLADVIRRVLARLQVKTNGAHGDRIAAFDRREKVVQTVKYLISERGFRLDAFCTSHVASPSKDHAANHFPTDTHR